MTMIIAETSHLCQKVRIISQAESFYWKNKAKKGRGADDRNINVRAAFIHVIGDLIQSIGLVIAGYIIKFFVSNSIPYV